MWFRSPSILPGWCHLTTKYKLLNGESVKYKYLGGEIHEIPQNFLEYLLPKKAEVKPQENKRKQAKMRL